jgi:molecular chaperone GrpE
MDFHYYVLLQSFDPDNLTFFQDHYLRALAEAENLRERTRREKEMAQQLAIKNFAKDLLSVTDVLEIALNSVPEQARNDDSNPHLKNLYTGLSMTNAELLASFRRHGLEPFEAMGQKFDPNCHQALFQAPIPDKEPGTVFDVSKKGYMLHGIVIRAAQVGVVQDKA